MNILISFLGSTLDNHGGRGEARWSVWRPSVAIAMQENLHFDRYYLLYSPHCKPLFETVVSDIKTCSPDTEVIGEEMPLENPWDFEEVYAKLYDFSREEISAPTNMIFISISPQGHTLRKSAFFC